MRPLFLTITLLLPIFHAFAADDWSLRKSDEKNHIHIYTRDVSGSDLKEFRGELVVKSRLSALVALVEDSHAAPQWIYQCRALEQIERRSDYEKVFYMVTDAPWPVSDRDSVFRSLLSQEKDSGIVHIDMLGEPELFPENEDYLRIRQMAGFWEFIPLGDGDVKVIYQVHVEPGGGIPGWLANSVVVENPYNTLKKMRELVQQPVYQSTDLIHITNVD